MTNKPAVDVADDAVLNWLSDQNDNMINLLRDIVNIDSNSYDKRGVDRAGEVINQFFQSHNVPVSTIPQGKFGDILRVEVLGGEGRPAVLMGHRDTVFPSGTVRRRPFTIRDGRAYGPGVADMKSGIVMNCFVLAAFARFGGANVPLVGLFTGEEEIGSPVSRPVIERECSLARAVFNAESGRANGNIVVARRGCIFIRLEVTGQAAHSGVNFEKGRSAIVELAHKIAALHALGRPEDEVTINVGLISGGQSVNTVAPNASAEIDVRYYEPEDRERILDQVSRIADQVWVPETRARWEIYGEFLPMNETDQSRKLFSAYLESCAAVGLPQVKGEKAGGAADSGFAAATGTPTLCGLGPVGGFYHSDDEYMEIDTFGRRAKALALTIRKLAS